MRRLQAGWRSGTLHLSIPGFFSIALADPSIAPPARSRRLRRPTLAGLVVGFLLGEDQPDPLAHATRRAIYEHLVRLPGDHFRSIARTLHIAQGSARYHLGVLVDRGLVSVEKFDGRARYFALGPRAEAERNELFKKHWKFRNLRARVLLVSRESPSPSATYVADRLGISRQLAAYHLAHLKKSGLLGHEKGPHRP